MKGLEFLQVKERTAACAESAEAAGHLSPKPSFVLSETLT